MPRFTPKDNFKKSRKEIGYLPRNKASQADYDRIGFKAGLEVHQQLKTRDKLFCRCPAGIYHGDEDYDAEIIRHMRPTLSELGEYDGTALMEFKTRKNIIYRIKNPTTCTYEIDDTPPFPINREALKIALEISLLCGLNIVGELHITRKQYLDGSIPTGFQRTAILGVEGGFPLRGRKIRLVQLSIEEDSCREISDIGHTRTYKTDRLGIPLIETVTYPDFTNPDEVREGADYIRFLNRSTGKVVVGSGAAREDVNVSCRGGTRVEIKGVSSNSLIPELTHNEVFRQWALLHIRERLRSRSASPAQGTWSVQSVFLDPSFRGIDKLRSLYDIPEQARFAGVNLPGFQGILSHFTQPGKIFADEISDRIKVIACIEKPHLIHSEQWEPSAPPSLFNALRARMSSAENDAQLLIWGPAEDIPTALETIEERCRLAFEGVPNESRKSFPDGTTVFERVLPGPDRMYPDTDSPPLPIEDSYIEQLKKDLPIPVRDRLNQFDEWDLPPDTHTYLLRNNLAPLLEKIIHRLGLPPRFTAVLFAHTLKNIQGRRPSSPDFQFTRVYDLLHFLNHAGLDVDIAKDMLAVAWRYPRMDFESVLATLKFRKVEKKEILSRIPYLKKKFAETGSSSSTAAEHDWIMGELRKVALGNMPLRELSLRVKGTGRKPDDQDSEASGNESPSRRGRP